MSKEKKLQKKIIALLQSKGAYVIKTIVTNRTGIPDIIACYKGYFISIEVKGESKLTALQEYNINYITKAGGKAIVAYNLGDVNDLLDIIDN